MRVTGFRLPSERCRRQPQCRTLVRRSRRSFGFRVFGVRNRLCYDTPLARKFATAQRGLATIRRQFRRFVAGDKCRGSQDWRYDGQLVKALIDCLTVGVYANTRGTHPMTKLSEYLHTAASAEYLGVAQNTLRKWAALGRLPMHRNPANGYRLFKRSDLDKFLKETAKPVNSGI